MSWRVFGNRFLTADFGGAPVHYQCFSPTEDMFLKAVQSWFIFYNNPTWTTLGMKIYSVKNSIPYQALYTADTNTASADWLQTYHNAVRAGYFAFSSPPPLKGGDIYALVPTFASYTGDQTAHIGWRKAFPKKIYDHYVALNGADDVNNYPFDFTLIVGFP